MPPGDETFDAGPDEWPYYFFGGLAVLDPQAAVDAVAKLPDATPDERRIGE